MNIPAAEFLNNFLQAGESIAACEVLQRTSTLNWKARRAMDK